MCSKWVDCEKDTYCSHTMNTAATYMVNIDNSKAIQGYCVRKY